MAAELNGPALARELDLLVAGPVVYFPIRHHSPACSWYLEQLLRARPPDSILIEGPACFTSLIPLLLHKQARAPFAIYTSVDRPAEAEGSCGAQDAPMPASFRPPRRAAFFPFCDYSPELVALRVGRELGASLQFIDLDYAEQIHAESAGVPPADGPRIDSLLAERHFERSRLLQALARRTGCRDHNALWDHCFETRPATPAAGGLLNRGVQAERFIRDVGAWCWLARAGTGPEELAAEGTLAREAAMAAAIQQELARGRRSVVVVTGGFHAVVLPGLVAGPRFPASARRKTNDEEIPACLVRYSYEQLDALNGYAAGMPSPAYYDQLWRNLRRPDPGEAFTELAAAVLVELGRLTRRQKMAVAVSAADEIAALEQARRLAALRGHPGPTREDLLDGIRSCFVKGAMEAEGAVVLGLARHVLAGAGVGEVPPEAGAPPLVTDFRENARRLRLRIDDSIARKLSLDLYRKAAHRQASRFLHSLVFLEAPFATLVAGPDFVRGQGLERLIEHWEYQWMPATEGRLVEAGLFGATVEDATAQRLAWTIAGLEGAGRGRDASEAVGLLIQACRMGLHRHAARLLDLIAAQVHEDPQLTSLAGALSQLQLLWDSREPLEAQRLPAIPQLIRTMFARACYLLSELPDTSAEAAPGVLEALVTMRGVVRAAAGEPDPLDPELFWQPLARLMAMTRTPPLLLGGIAGLLHAEGRLPESEVLRLLIGNLEAVSGRPGEQTDFLVGLLQTSRELAWRQPALLGAVDRLLRSWSEDEFLRRVPHLRLAFAGLTPRETDQVAAAVSTLQDGASFGGLNRQDVTEAEAVAAARLNAAVRESLVADGLAAWIGSSA